MYKPTFPSSASQRTHSQPIGEQSITFQSFDSFRKTDEQKNLFIITTTESFFKRQCTEQILSVIKSQSIIHNEPGLLLLVLFYCDRATILDLRLTSQGFYYLASKIPAPNFLCPLANVSAIFHQSFSELSDLSIQNKISFAQENCLEVYINIPLADFPNPPAAPSTIRKDKLFFASAITDIAELNLLQTWLLNKQNSAPLKKLRKLDFSKLPIDSHIHLFNTLFSTIAQNLASLPNLITIFTSKIPSNMTLPPLKENNRIITIKQVEESQSLLTSTNIVAVGTIGLGLFAVWKWWNSSNDSDDKKKK